MAKKTNDNNTSAEGVAETYKGKGKGSNPNSLKNLKRRTKAEPKAKKYMQIDVADYDDYLRYMAKLRNKPITKYVVELIKADYEQNKDLYEALKRDNYIEK